MKSGDPAITAISSNDMLFRGTFNLTDLLGVIVFGGEHTGAAHNASHDFLERLQEKKIIHTSAKSNTKTV